MKRNNIVEEIRHTIHLKLPQYDVWLYGSEARGDAHADSDIDLLMLMDVNRVTLNDRIQVSASLQDIEMKNGITINPVIYTKQEWATHNGPFYNNVMRERIKL